MKVKTIAMGCGILSTNLAYYWKNIFDVEELVNQQECKKEGSPVPLSKNIQNLLTTVMKDMKLSENQQSLINFFVVNDLQIKHLGFSGHKPGAFVGIPKNFVFDFDQLNFQDLPFKVDLGTLQPSELSILKSNLALSEKAKKFAIAQEIYKSGHLGFYGPCSISLLLFCVSYAIILLAEKLKPPLIVKYKLIFFSQVVITMIFFYLSSLVTVNDHQLGYGDVKAAKLGKEYFDGGMEYLEKMSKIKNILEKSEKNILEQIWSVFFKDINSLFYLNYRLSFFKKNQKDEVKSWSAWDYVLEKKNYIIKTKSDIKSSLKENLKLSSNEVRK